MYEVHTAIQTVIAALESLQNQSGPEQEQQQKQQAFLRLAGEHLRLLAEQPDNAMTGQVTAAPLPSATLMGSRMGARLGASLHTLDAEVHIWAKSGANVRATAGARHVYQ